MTPEGKVKSDIKKWLVAQGAYFFMPVPTGYGKKTIDFLICLRGRFIGLETKKKGVLIPTPLQRITMDEIEAAGGWAFCVDSLDKLVEELNAKARDEGTGGSFW